MIFWIILIIVLVCILALYKYFTRNFSYWKDRNVPYLKPLPFLGNFGEMLSGKHNVGIWFDKLYRYSDKPFFGIFAFDTPALVVRSPELIKIILQRDFNVFDNRSAAEIKHEPLTGQMIFFLRASKWKFIRQKSSPLFTSGKLKKMIVYMTAICEDMIKYLNKKAGESIQAKEVGTRFSTDVISKCVLGLDAGCFEHQNSKVREVGKRLFAFNVRNALSQLSIMFAPNFAKLFRAVFFDNSVIMFAKQTMSDVIKTREENNIKKNDLIDILVDMKKHPSYMELFDEDTVLALALNFFAAGLETTGSTISFCLYELTINPECQTKVREEVIRTIEENGPITYNMISNLKYTKMCILETLRKYPALAFLDRECNRDYIIPETNVVLTKGTPVYISLTGLHYDEKYFPNPSKFDPERFADLSHINREGLYYLPFGDGPRACLGERFAMMETKLALIYILSKFQMKPTKDTKIPLVYEPKSLLLQSTCGLPIKFEPLENNK